MLFKPRICIGLFWMLFIYLLGHHQQKLRIVNRRRSIDIESFELRCRACKEKETERLQKENRHKTKERGESLLGMHPILMKINFFDEPGKTENNGKKNHHTLV